MNSQYFSNILVKAKDSIKETDQIIHTVENHRNEVIVRKEKQRDLIELPPIKSNMTDIRNKVIDKDFWDTPV